MIVAHEGTRSGRRRARAAARGLPLDRWGLRSVAVLYIGLVVVLPIAAIVQRGYADGLDSLQRALATNGAISALTLTLATAAFVALVNGVLGTLLAYVLVRCPFRGRAILASLVDLPFAIPTLVTGVMLVALYGPNSPVGAALDGVGLQVTFAVPGIILALLIVTLPLVVRAVEPVLIALDFAEEEAAYALGASARSTFWRVVLPALRPAIATGVLLSFARALGEFGSLVVVAGNITGRTLTAPVFIFQLTSQFRYAEAAAVSVVLFAISATVVLVTQHLASGSRAR